MSAKVIRIEEGVLDPLQWRLELELRSTARMKMDAERLLALYPWWRVFTRAKLRSRIAELSETIYELGLELAAIEANR